MGSTARAVGSAGLRVELALDGKRVRQGSGYGVTAPDGIGARRAVVAVRAARWPVVVAADLGILARIWPTVEDSRGQGDGPGCRLRLWWRAPPCG